MPAIPVLIFLSPGAFTGENGSGGGITQLCDIRCMDSVFRITHMGDEPPDDG